MNNAATRIEISKLIFKMEIKKTQKPLEMKFLFYFKGDHFTLYHHLLNKKRSQQKQIRQKNDTWISSEAREQDNP